MKIVNASYKKYSLPFTKPLQLGNLLQHRREGYILKIECDNGYVGYGESSPLYSVHTESLDQVERELKVLVSSLKGRNLEDPGKAKNWRFIPDQGLLNCNVWAFEQAMFPLIADLFFPQEVSNFSMKLAGLIHLTHDKMSWERSIRPHINHYKVKVGRMDVQSEVLKLKDLISILPEGSKIRLDGNKGMNPSSLLVLLDHLPHEMLDYVEEPFEHFEDYEKVTGIDFALDEMLWDQDPECMDIQFSKAYILKPSRMGGLFETIRWIEYVKSVGKRVVLSSCYETGLSMITYYSLCSRFDLIEAMGLGTYSFLGQDISLSKIENLSKPRVENYRITLL